MIPRRKNRVPAPPDACPLTACMAIIGGAWTPNIIWYLSQAPRRFSELKYDLQGISAKVLAERLKRLEQDGIVLRASVASSPPTVEYRLSPLGLELKPAIEAIVSVGERLKQMKVNSGVAV